MSSLQASFNEWQDKMAVAAACPLYRITESQNGRGWKGPLRIIGTDPYWLHQVEYSGLTDPEKRATDEKFTSRPEYLN